MAKKNVKTTKKQAVVQGDFVDLYIRINNRKLSEQYQFRKVYSSIYDCDEYVWMGELPKGATIKFTHADKRMLPNVLAYNQISGPGVTLSGGEACMDLYYTKALICPVEGVDMIYNFVDTTSRLHYRGKKGIRTIYLRIYDNATGIDNDRWLAISME